MGEIFVSVTPVMNKEWVTDCRLKVTPHPLNVSGHKCSRRLRGGR